MTELELLADQVQAVKREAAQLAQLIAEFAGLYYEARTLGEAIEDKLVFHLAEPSKDNGG